MFAANTRHTKKVCLCFLLAGLHNAKVTIKIGGRNKVDPHTHERTCMFSC